MTQVKQWGPGAAVRNIGTSFRLSIASFKLLFRTPRVLLLPLGTLLWTGLLAFTPISLTVWGFRNHPEATARFWQALFYPATQAFQRGDWLAGIGWSIAEGYALYAVWLTIVLTGLLYFLTVGMHVATQQIRKPKSEPSMGAGFRLANQNLGRLFLMALFTATVFAWIRYVVRWGFGLATLPLMIVPFLGTMVRRAILGTVGWLLTAVNYLMLPIVVYERQGAFSAMKSAWTNVKQTWSGMVVGSSLLFVGVWFVMQWFALPLAQVAFRGSITAGLITMIVTAAIVYAFSSASSAAMRATLYWYATTGEVPQGFRVEDLPQVTHANQKGIAGSPFAV